MSSIRVDVRQVTGLADRFAELTPDRIGRGALQAVNEVTAAFSEKAEDGALANINLTSAYYREKQTVTLGKSPLEPRAQIKVDGDLTVLGRFPGTTSFTQPGAPRRAGPVRGRRSAGVRAQITRSASLREPQWFTMKLRNQQGLLGVFVRDDSIAARNARDGVAGKRHIYGPSPYALFREQVRVQGPQLERDLEDRAVTLIGGTLREVLE